LELFAEIPCALAVVGSPPANKITGIAQLAELEQLERAHL
jgi:hypothetical protein